MAVKKEEKQGGEYLPNIKPGTPEMEVFLAAGYPDIGSRAHAQEIIKTRRENPALVPWELSQRAEAYLAALDTKAVAIDPKPGQRDVMQSGE